MNNHFILIVLLTMMAVFSGKCGSETNRNSTDSTSTTFNRVDSTSTTLQYVDDSHSYLKCPDGKHPHLIDLGLPSGTKWACCNMGADSPEDFGAYYSWGETEPKDKYGCDNYIYRGSSHVTQINLGENICGTKYDVVHVKWGGAWQMPSFWQMEELLNNCSYEWAEVNGVGGRKFTASNGGSIFLPAAGLRYMKKPPFTGRGGEYWTGTHYPEPEHVNLAYVLSFYGNGNELYYCDRCYGLSIRPVAKK